MNVFGLTGGIGSGKSAVAALLEGYGIPVVSADELSRMVVAPGSDGLNDVVKAFGTAVLTASGSLDRQSMGKIIFSDSTKRKQLESILHPRIRERYDQVLDALEKGSHPVVIYEVPLLFEKNLQGEMKSVILVSAPQETRINRVRARDGFTREEVTKRIAAQMPEEEKRRRADYIVHNDGTLDDLRQEVAFLASRFLKQPGRQPRNRPTSALGRPSPIRNPEVGEIVPTKILSNRAATKSPPPAEFQVELCPPPSVPPPPRTNNR